MRRSRRDATVLRADGCKGKQRLPSLDEAALGVGRDRASGSDLDVKNLIAVEESGAAARIDEAHASP